MKRDINRILIKLLFFTWFWALSSRAQSLDSLVSHSLVFSRQQLDMTILQIGNTTQFPRSTLEDGTWKLKDSGSWTSGFFPGCLWYMYELTSDENLRNWAESWTASMEQEKYDTGSHDIGFKMFCSFGNGFRLTQNEEYRSILLKSAESLTKRYNPTVGCIKSWNSGSRGQYPVIIDNMMNLELLLWASKQPGGDNNWYDIAMSHSLKTIENHIREDGSTYHVVDYNPLTGEVIKKNTVQGYSDDSAWARGQAWGLYGFTMVYRETDDDRFLEAAIKLADYYIENLPEDHVPYWDFNAPNIPDEKKDASSAAIACSGLFELSTLVKQTEKTEKYLDAAYDILTSLCSSTYLAEGSNSNGILLHGVGNHNSGSEVDVSLIYADYYFIEALLRYQNIDNHVLVYAEQSPVIPNTIQLLQNYPNPFNPETTISYSLRSPSRVEVSIYNIGGRLVKTLWKGDQDRGEHQILFNSENLSSGTYILTIKTTHELMSRKMILLK